MSKEDIFKNSELLELSEAKLSDLSEDENDHEKVDRDNIEERDLLKLDDLEKIEREPKFFISNKDYQFNSNERIDVYIKNYLSKFEMTKTLKMFDQEFYEFLSKEKIMLEDIPKVPEVYIQSEKIQQELSNIQKELDDAKISAEKAKSMFQKLKNEKENEKIKHRRVQQEKRKLIKEVDKIKNVYNEDNKIYKELKKKYWDVTNESLLLENEQTKYKSTFSVLKEQYDKYKKTLDDIKKQRESK